MKDVINLQKSHTQDPALQTAKRRFCRSWMQEQIIAHAMAASPMPRNQRALQWL